MIDKLGATVGARLILLSLGKTKGIRKRGTVSEMRKTSSTDQGIYIPDDLHSTPRNATLVREVLAEAKKLVDMGYNARFTCDNKIHQKAVEDRLKNSEDTYSSKIFSGSEYDLACQVIEEAKKIVRSGWNARIGCADVETNTSDREKRREYYRWKRMNR